VQIDHFCFRVPPAQDFLVRADQFNAPACDGQRLSPRDFRIPGVDAAMNQDLVRGRQGYRQKQQRGHSTDAHKVSAASHSVTLDTNLFAIFATFAGSRLSRY